MKRRAPHLSPMRILLDEDLPRRLASLLVGHNVSTVQRSGWTRIENGKLLALAVAELRVIALAPKAKILYCVAFVDRGEVRRIISLRRANRREVKHYVKSI